MKRQSIVGSKVMSIDLELVSSVDVLRKRLLGSEFDESPSINAWILWVIDSEVVPSIDVEVVQLVDVEVVPSIDVESVPSVNVEVVLSINVEVEVSIDAELVSVISASSTLLSSPDLCCSSPSAII
ncbi:hypothetical protein DY000_02048127 [Brassica cretica]|uniref:Uncharacterized protein n=1 Tax=Brassica cretica TaxID=69181 RepID=A0ABQ7EPD2_BRACR|nr:hypothetical protein DY000_02048127 [Brassica cretica]